MIYWALLATHNNYSFFSFLLKRVTRHRKWWESLIAILKLTGWARSRSRQYSAPPTIRALLANHSNYSYLRVFIEEGNPFPTSQNMMGKSNCHNVTYWMSQIKVKTIVSTADIRQWCTEAHSWRPEFSFDRLRIEPLDPYFDDDVSLCLNQGYSLVLLVTENELAECINR